MHVAQRALAVSIRARHTHSGRTALMDFTPEDMEAVQACLEGIDRNVPVTGEAAAAVLLMPNAVRTVSDILVLPEWPAEQLRLVVERWQPDVEVRIERIR